MDDNDCLDCDDVHNDDDDDHNYDDADHNDGDNDDNNNNNDVQPRQIGNGRGKGQGVEAIQGVARHGKVRHLEIWKFEIGTRNFTLKFEKVSFAENRAQKMW